MIKYFDSESRTIKYIVKDNNWHPDEEHINQLTQLRHMELGDMKLTLPASNVICNM